MHSAQSGLEFAQGCLDLLDRLHSPALAAPTSKTSFKASQNVGQNFLACQFSPSPSGLAGSSRAFANVECTSRSARVHVCPTYFEGRAVVAAPRHEDFGGRTAGLLCVSIPRLPKCTRLRKRLCRRARRERALALLSAIFGTRQRRPPAVRRKPF